MVHVTPGETLHWDRHPLLGASFTVCPAPGVQDSQGLQIQPRSVSSIGALVSDVLTL